MSEWMCWLPGLPSTLALVLFYVGWRKQTASPTFPVNDTSVFYYIGAAICLLVTVGMSVVIGVITTLETD